jgi:Flp pilus assembly protein TadG
MMLPVSGVQQTYFRGRRFAQENRAMKLSQYSKGQMAIVMTLVIATLLGVMALGTDVGVMYYQWELLQKGADAAALAGANYLSENLTGESYTGTVNAACSGEPDDAQKAACTYAMSNNLSNASLKYNETQASAAPNTPNIQVVATRTGLPYFFGQIIGLSTYNVAAAATATQGSTGATTGLFPMGIQCTPPCSLSSINPGSAQQFNVKFSPTGADTGNWQWLQSGNGSQGVAAAITSGMPGTYDIGGTVTSETGNFANSNNVQTAFSNRFSTSNCNVLASDPCNGGSTTNIPSNDPCLITVPAVNFVGTGKTTFTIEGFAQVYIEPGSTATGTPGITACFIQQVDPNAVASGGPALGSLGRPILVQ